MQSPKHWALEIEDMRGNPSDEISAQQYSGGILSFEHRKVPHESLTEPLLEDFAHTTDRDLSSNKDEDGSFACCRCSGFGMHLSPFLLLLVFIYVNLLNYIDRGLVNGVLPTYCVNCPDQNSSMDCSSHRSCAWDQTAGTLHDDSNLFFLAIQSFTTASSGLCGFNTSVRPQMGIAGSFHLNETEQVRSASTTVPNGYFSYELLHAGHPCWSFHGRLLCFQSYLCILVVIQEPVHTNGFR